MNSKLKKLGELEQRLPSQCNHPIFYVGVGQESVPIMKEIVAAYEACLDCKRSGRRLFILDLSSGSLHRELDRQTTDLSGATVPGVTHK